jgi:hypothetical protein
MLFDGRAREALLLSVDIFRKVVLPVFTGTGGTLGNLLFSVEMKTQGLISKVLPPL